ncbi:type VI secretion system tip protein TssI/VgrG [Pseudomonas sp. 10B1]|uniref:type VI secretion system Vgr family protein n=1 Tax=unclassified Pseudomonas TaxID=196821 RepID=UPI002AB36E6C|nr:MULTISPECIES: type VI secretion system tip protein TssI/VgrG [unclassified Pseudomonas]MDY7560588.1 type VI secretion system tip protein TssI/VgrG [Pseudomonas sp. AB6]MEA9993344.1 type VI secretion system tip protein TssI/VgrG [Pseudomonas sp. AA4]MEB0088466.1 type VI secretion system tip protein TssI/VgrG [Pseudomonas sp. RTI1]MEB0124169.1 type VI secretion system tip protein TssI/VgrG [Pseudomonas sp. CCC1.2]MEB0152628.1 type VI secretion system tip protein TssI/VgrG [Pseudomonas sp. CCC
MSQEKETLITLTVANAPLELRVTHFRGCEALNRPYWFEIDLVSPNVYLEVKLLKSRSAFLCIGEEQNGVHGLIGSVLPLYVGKTISHFRVTLEPRLQALQQRYHQRLFQGLSVPQIIKQILEEHGIGDDHYRFEPLVGLYPPRETCAQYDENNLHLLQRLCAEEGIHFRFEHHRNQHVVIFGDDPANFSELPRPARYQKTGDRDATHPAISHMVETYAFDARPEHCTPFAHQSPHDAEEDSLPSPDYGHAANQSCDTFKPSKPPEIAETRLRQLSERTLERMRCERRYVHGVSNQPMLSSGRILWVIAHPNGMFNDHWLLTELHHAGKQPQVLDGLDPLDTKELIEQASLDHDQWPPTFDLESNDRGVKDLAPLTRGYRNHFRAIPWAMSYRPSLIPYAPKVSGHHTATLMGENGLPITRDALGRVQVKLRWPQIQSGNEACVWLPLAIGAPSTRTTSDLLAGTEVMLNYFDGDLNRPVIVDTVSGQATPRPEPSICIDGQSLGRLVERIHLSAGQTLRADAPSPMTLATADTRIELHTDHIRISNPKRLSRSICEEEPTLYEKTPEPDQPDPSPTRPDFSALFQWVSRY